MNRYDWITWVCELLVNRDVRAAAKREVIALETAVLDGTEKRKIIENILLPGVISGGIYLARALIELWLGQIRTHSSDGEVK